MVRILPTSCGVKIRRDSWKIPAIFQFLQKAGNVTATEMLRTFNCGIGLIAAVGDESVDEVTDRLTAMGIDAFHLGEVVAREPGAPQLEWN